MSQNEIWVTTHGDRIAVKDMTEQHAKNALSLLLRRLREAEEARKAQVNASRIFRAEINSLDVMHEQDWRGTKGASQ